MADGAPQALSHAEGTGPRIYPAERSPGDCDRGHRVDLLIQRIRGPKGVGTDSQTRAYTLSDTFGLGRGSPLDLWPPLRAAEQLRIFVTLLILHPNTSSILIRSKSLESDPIKTLIQNPLKSDSQSRSPVRDLILADLRPPAGLI